MKTIDADSSVLVLVDYQTRLMPAIHEGAAALATATLLGRAARLLDVPAIGTEHNPERLGPNDGAVRELCRHVLAKTHFGACADGLVGMLDAARPGFTQAIVAGCETHVCMMQTALGLLAAGKQVFVVENASSSRRPLDHAAALRRLAQAGATIVTHEMVLFEWLHDCRHPRFREVLALVKSAP